MDVKTASIGTTALWDALKSFTLNSLKINVLPTRLFAFLFTCQRKLVVTRTGESDKYCFVHVRSSDLPIYLFFWV